MPRSNVHREEYSQLNMFESLQIEEKKKKNRKIQKAVLDIKSRYGKNAVVKGMDLEEHGTTMERNNQIGGHRA